MSQKYYISLDDYERGTIINCLNEKRNELIADGNYTDAVDEVLLKILNAKQKKFKEVYSLIMEKRIYNEQTGIGYTFQGDYNLPDLALPEQEDKPIGL